MAQDSEPIAVRSNAQREQLHITLDNQLTLGLIALHVDLIDILQIILDFDDGISISLNCCGSSLLLNIIQILEPFSLLLLYWH